MRTFITVCITLLSMQASAVDTFYAHKLEDFRQQVTVDTVAKVLNYSDGLPDEGGSGSFWYAYNAKDCVYRKAGYSFVSSSADFKTVTYDVDQNQRELNLNSFSKDSIRYQSYDLRYPADGRVTKRVVVIADGRDIFSTEGIQPDRIAKGWSLIYSKYCAGAKKEF